METCLSGEKRLSLRGVLLFNKLKLTGKTKVAQQYKFLFPNCAAHMNFISVARLLVSGRERQLRMRANCLLIVYNSQRQITRLVVFATLAIYNYVLRCSFSGTTHTYSRNSASSILFFNHYEPDPRPSASKGRLLSPLESYSSSKVISSPPSRSIASSVSRYGVTFVRNRVNIADEDKRSPAASAKIAFGYVAAVSLYTNPNTKG